MVADQENTPKIEALRLLDAFEKSGARTFDLTITDLDGRKVHFRRQLTPYRLRMMMPELLKNSATLQHNVIVRPRTIAGIEHIQLDDLTAEAVEKVKPAAFLCLQTSPGNFQAWVAVRDSGDPDFARRLRKGVGADPTASGATRVAGHPNFKDKYAPDFPRVEITHLALGHIVSKDELEEQGLVAPREEPKPSRLRVSPTRSGVRKWPSYQRCVENAPPNHSNTGPDISRADFTWCMTAIDWGWGVDEVAARLMEESGKASENGEKYALATAQGAAAAVQRRAGAGRSQSRASGIGPSIL
jgi:hypothetical protein